VKLEYKMTGNAKGLSYHGERGAELAKRREYAAVLEVRASFPAPSSSARAA
jgi:hypothetical protein